ncbi:MAG: RNA methyltransferase, partial [Bacilli bacterium]|nr:RNA methyltransferase [Bacilli bacterium]
LNINVSIAHGLVKRDKQEEVIRRLVEIGAYEYIPVNMARSVIKLKKSDYHFENDRLNRIVKEASEQSHRNNFLKLADVIDFKDLVNNFKNYDLVLYADANKKDDLALRDLLKLEDKRNILVLIGPEGGFSEEEHNLLLNNDLVHTISLGKRILRTETAPLVIMSILAYEVE